MFTYLLTDRERETRLNDIHCTGQQKLVWFHPPILLYNKTKQTSHNQHVVSESCLELLNYTLSSE